MGASTFVGIADAAVTTRLNTYIPTYIADAAVAAGLPPTSLPGFIGALAGNQPQLLPGIPGVTPAIIQAGVGGLFQAVSFR